MAWFLSITRSERVATSKGNEIRNNVIHPEKKEASRYTPGMPPEEGNVAVVI
jgi:hypothetical protein